LLTKLNTALQIGRTFGMRDGFLRLQYELRRGSGLMSWRMRSVNGWNAWQLDRVAPGVQPHDLLTDRRDGKVKFFFSDARSLQASLKEILTPEQSNAVLLEADQIIAGKLSFFGARQRGH
jgi:hypothetical protein